MKEGEGNEINNVETSHTMNSASKWELENMEEVLIEVDNISSSRPSLEQVKAVVDFMQKHPDLAKAKLRKVTSRQKAKRLWTELSNIANSIAGTTKTTQGWMRFWMDKKCMIKSKKAEVDNGKRSSILTPIEEKIWNLCFQNNGNTTQIKSRKSLKKEVSEEEDSSEEIPLKRMKSTETFDFNEHPIPDAEERQMAIMEKLVQVMDKQASALTQMAQSSLSNAQAMDRFAEASQIQAQAIERLASSFENIGAVVHDVRNAIINIDYTMKRCYNINQT